MQDTLQKPPLPRLIINDSVHLQGVLTAIWRLRFVVLGVLVLSIALCSIWLHSLVPTYTATLKLIPPMVSSDSMKSDLSGLASLASLGGLTNTDLPPFALYKESVSARQVADKLSQDQEILREVFSSEWDSSNQRWREPKSTYRAVTSMIGGIFGFPDKQWQAPDGARLQQFIEKNVEVEENRKQPIITLTLKYKDPEFAIRFLDVLDKAINEEIRSSALKRSDSYVEYLVGRLSSANVPDYREALIRSIVAQETFRMTASSNLPFAADRLQPPIASTNPTGPNAGVFLAAAIFLGTVLGCLVALLWTVLLLRKQTYSFG